MNMLNRNIAGPLAALSLFSLASAPAAAEEAAVLRDLDAQGRVTLSKDELTQLLPGAKMSRFNAKGNTNAWKNDADGTFIISSDNRDKGGRNSSAQGKWHISDDGRYCVLIEWRVNPTEEWCRYIVKSGADYYATKSDKTGTERVHKLSISK
ncbi:MAG: DUF995 domain-containing protein [Burkholderiales bacterium]